MRSILLLKQDPFILRLSLAADTSDLNYFVEEDYMENTCIVAAYVYITVKTSHFHPTGSE